MQRSPRSRRRRDADPGRAASIADHPDARDAERLADEARVLKRERPPSRKLPTELCADHRVREIGGVRRIHRLDPAHDQGGERETTSGIAVDHDGEATRARRHVDLDDVRRDTGLELDDHRVAVRDVRGAAPDEGRHHPRHPGGSAAHPRQHREQAGDHHGRTQPRHTANGNAHCERRHARRRGRAELALRRPASSSKGCATVPRMSVVSTQPSKARSA